VRITALGPSTRRLLTVDTYLAADRGASVRMGWRQLQDVPFALAGDLSDLPPDLQTIVGLLQGADLSGVEGEGGPGASDPQLQRRIEEERQGLITRFLTVRWTANADGLADTLYVTGQVPIYDDVDSVFSRTAVEPGMAYEVSAARSLVDDDVLARASTAYPDWVQDRYLSLPETVTPRTVALAHQLTESSSTPLEKARIIESFVRTTIAYDEGVSAPPDDADMVDYALFERQRGYCEYYASAMAVMLRSVGVPARVAVGFYPGEYDPEQRGTVYRQKNAHAWVEVFFPDYGWVSFEPTASRPLMDSGSAGSLEPTPPEATPPLQDVASELSTPTPSLDDAATPVPPPPVATPVDGGRGPGWAWPVAIAAAMFAGLAGIGWVLWMLPLHGAAPSSALFLRLRRLGRFLGIPAAATETPREYARSFTAAVPASREHVARIVSAYELDQFGPDPADSRLISTATGAWRSMRRQAPSWVLQRRFGRK
jgi:transglutaminase-like putative cysteine protease